MAITDELRDEVFYAPMEPDQRGRFNTIADRIDAEHEKACDDAWDNGYEADYLGIENWLIEHQQVMEHHGYIELPKDADGEHIHIGDVMAYSDNTKPMEVVALVPPAVFITEEGPRYADMCRHYHAPTVEDLLCEMLDAVNDDRYGQDRIIAEFAAKLRLAESEES